MERRASLHRQAGARVQRRGRTGGGASMRVECSRPAADCASWKSRPRADRPRPHHPPVAPARHAPRRTQACRLRHITATEPTKKLSPHHDQGNVGRVSRSKAHPSERRRQVQHLLVSNDPPEVINPTYQGNRYYFEMALDNLDDIKHIAQAEYRYKAASAPSPSTPPTASSSMATASTSSRTTSR